MEGRLACLMNGLLLSPATCNLSKLAGASSLARACVRAATNKCIKQFMSPVVVRCGVIDKVARNRRGTASSLDEAGVSFVSCFRPLPSWCVSVWVERGGDTCRNRSYRVLRVGVVRRFTAYQLSVATETRGAPGTG